MEQPGRWQAGNHRSPVLLGRTAAYSASKSKSGGRDARLDQPARRHHFAYGQESIGISGLVLHVLHRTPGPSPAANDVSWMIDLPSELPAPKDAFSAGQPVYVTDQRALEDPTHEFSGPWLIIGTADAYSRGSLSQRAQACRLFHEIPGKRHAIATELRDMPWLAAETLIALRHLQGDDVI